MTSHGQPPPRSNTTACTPRFQHLSSTAQISTRVDISFHSCITHHTRFPEMATVESYVHVADPAACSFLFVGSGIMICRCACALTIKVKLRDATKSRFRWLLSYLPASPIHHPLHRELDGVDCMPQVTRRRTCMHPLQQPTVAQKQTGDLRRPRASGFQHILVDSLVLKLES